MIYEFIILISIAIGLIIFLAWFILRSIRGHKAKTKRIEWLETQYAPHTNREHSDYQKFLKIAEEELDGGSLKGKLKMVMEIKDISIALYDSCETDIIADDIYHIALVYGKDEVIIGEKESLLTLFMQITTKCD